MLPLTDIRASVFFWVFLIQAPARDNVNESLTLINLIKKSTRSKTEKCKTQFIATRLTCEKSTKTRNRWNCFPFCYALLSFDEEPKQVEERKSESCNMSIHFNFTAV